MALVRRDRPVTELPDLWRRLFDTDVSGWLRLEEFRDGDDQVIRAELPGIDPDRDVELTVADGVLHISARREEQSKQKDKESYRSEFRYGAFMRSLALPPGVKEDDIKASYRDGILEIRIPMGDEKSAATKVPISRG